MVSSFTFATREAGSGVKRRNARYGFVLGALSVAALIAASPIAEAQTLRVAHDAGMGGSENIDPISPNRFAETNLMLYSRLVRDDTDGMIVPDLAEEWSASPDAKIWTFKLREGVTFHNGNPLTAEDIVFSLMRTQSEAIDSPLKGGLSLIESVEALDDLTAQVTLSSSHADFPLLLIDYRMRILDAETCNNDLDTLCESGIGTGPFKLVELDPLATTTVERFEDYWEGPAHVENIEIIAIADQQAKISALQAGQIDIVFTATGQQERLFAGNDRFQSQSVPTGRWTGLVMRTDTAPFDNPAVRKAMRVGVDRDAMGKLAFGESTYTVSCDHPVWAGDQYRVDLDCSQNQEEAKALMAEVFGEDIPTFELFVSDISEGAIQVAEVYQAQMKEIGVNVELAMAPSDGYWSDTWMKEPFFMTSWSQRPADQVLNEAYQSEAPWNESYFRNPAFDEALNNARQELDFEKRKELYGNTQRILWEEGGTLIPFHQNDLRIMSSDISGIPEVPMYSIRFNEIMKAE